MEILADRSTTSLVFEMISDATVFRFSKWNLTHKDDVFVELFATSYP